MSLSLGFIGSSEVKSPNARALLSDLIEQYRRNVRKAPVTFYLAIDNFTPTLDDLADFCVSSGYKLAFIGHSEAFDQEEVQRYAEDIVGRTFRIRPGQSVGRMLISALAQGAGQWVDPRLILCGDANEEDEVYAALALAEEKGMNVLTLLAGLDKVLFNDAEEVGEATVPIRDTDDELEPEDDELESDEEELEDDDDDDDDEGEDEDEDEDEDEEEGEGELVEDDEDEPEPDEEELAELEEEELAEDEADGEEEFEDDDEDGVAADELEEEGTDGDEPPEDQVEDEEPVVAPVRTKKTRAAKKPAATAKRWTARSLLSLAAKDREEFLAVLAQRRIKPGRGKRPWNLIDAYLEKGDDTVPSADQWDALIEEIWNEGSKTSSKKRPASTKKAARTATKKKAKTRTATAVQRRTTTVSSNGNEASAVRDVPIVICTTKNELSALLKTLIKQ